MKLVRLAVMASAAALLAPSWNRADDPARPLEAADALETLKGLAGEWAGGENGQNYGVSYRVMGNGSTVVETMMAGTDHEMISVYHLDGPDLRMTHYCAVGNQPRMKLDRAASTPKSLVFVFDGGTNMDPAKDMHIHEGKIVVEDTEHMIGEWTAFENGKAAHTAQFKVARKK